MFNNSIANKRLNIQFRIILQMKIKPNLIKLIVAFAMIAVVSLQVLWIYSYVAIGQQLLSQLILSTALIVGVIICLILLSKIVFLQYKAELKKKEFVETMTHKLKQPITSLMMTMEYLQNRIRKNELSSVDELLDDSHASLEKFNLYVDMIHDINRGEDEK